MQLTGECCCRMYPMIIRRPIWAISFSSVFPGLPGVLCQAFNLSSRFTTPSKICSKKNKKNKRQQPSTKATTIESLNLFPHLGATVTPKSHSMQPAELDLRWKRRVMCFFNQTLTLHPLVPDNNHTLLRCGNDFLSCL